MARKQIFQMKFRRHFAKFKLPEILFWEENKIAQKKEEKKASARPWPISKI